jgi:Ca-activated chloride channel family protein
LCLAAAGLGTVVGCGERSAGEAPAVVEAQRSASQKQKEEGPASPTPLATAPPADPSPEPDQTLAPGPGRARAQLGAAADRGDMGLMGSAPSDGLPTSRAYATPPPPDPNMRLSPPAKPRPLEPSVAPAPLAEKPIDPNGRFATTYRPGKGHLAAFESAIAAGILPGTEREVVSDIGARYAPQIDAPKEGALSHKIELERGKLAPSGGTVHVRLALRSSAEAARERPPLSVVVVMDVSGSMRGQLIQSAREAAAGLVDKLHAGDEFALVTFSTEGQVKIPIEKVGSRKEQLKKTIGEIKEGGGTNIGEGLRLGYAEATSKKASKEAVKVVMLMSDGRANEGITSSRQLATLALDAFQHGIQTSSFGMGTDYDGPLMSQIANDGAGGYYYLRDAAQIPGALSTELEKRLDPVATALEVRVRLKPDVELLNVYGSRRLSEAEAASVRTIEVAQDKQEEKKHGIKANRQNDTEGGMRFFIPAFARDDSHAFLLKLRMPEGVGAKDVALVELKYKDRITKKNVNQELPIKVEYANSDAESAKTIDPSVARTVQGFAAGEALMKAAALIGQRRNQEAVDLLGEREGILHTAAFTLGEHLFVEDAKRLARLRVHAAGRSNVKDPLVLAMMMETAGSVHLR